MQEDKQGKINDALLKVALGGSIAEVTEEYAEVDGALKLTKRKKTKRDVPPDLKALQLLLADSGRDIAAMSDEELEAERLRLIAALNEETAEKKETKKAVKVVKKNAAKGSGTRNAAKGSATAKNSGAAAKTRKKTCASKTEKKGAGI